MDQASYALIGGVRERATPALTCSPRLLQEDFLPTVLAPGTSFRSLGPIWVLAPRCLCCPMFSSLSGGADGLKRKYGADLKKKLSGTYSGLGILLGAGDTEVQKAGFLPRLSSGEGDSHPSDCQVRVSALSCRPRELSKAAQGRRCLSVFFMEDWEFSMTSREGGNMGHVWRRRRHPGRRTGNSW